LTEGKDILPFIAGGIMNIYIVRHAQTQSNKEKKVCGRTDLEITKEGIEEAKEASYIFKGKTFDALIFSPLIRTLETAFFIGKEAEFKTIRRDERIIEKEYGPGEGVDISKWWSMPYHPYPGEESQDVLIGRIHNAFCDYAQCYEEDVLVVTHGGVIGEYFLHRFPELMKDVMRIKNVSLWVLDGKTMEPLGMNLTGDEARRFVEEN
jgi:broad specificity phosphatase PhoE